MIRHLASIAEIVDDFDGAVVFYRDTLGATVKEESPGYAVFELPGVLHFAVWSRAAAAEATYGDAGATDRIPLGWSLGFEVDSVDAAATAVATVQAPKVEPWGQRTARWLSPSGALCEFSEAPWARTLSQDVKGAGS